MNKSEGKQEITENGEEEKKLQIHFEFFLFVLLFSFSLHLFFSLSLSLFCSFFLSFPSPTPSYLPPAFCSHCQLLLLMDPWLQIQLRIDQRDKLEQKDLAFFHAFSQLSLIQNPSGNADSVQLRKENALLLQENESLVGRLNLQAVQLENDQNNIRKLEKSLKSQENKIAKLQLRVSQLSEEIAEKNRSIEIINDEHLINSIQVNVLKDQVATLTKENEILKGGT